MAKIAGNARGRHLFRRRHGIFRELYDSLLVGASWHKPDHYFIFRDIEEYYQAILRANADYAQRERFAEKQLKNVANSAYFSSDRSVLGICR